MEDKYLKKVFTLDNKPQKDLLKNLIFLGKVYQNYQKKSNLKIAMK